MVYNIYFRHLLVLYCSGNMLSQGFKTFVNGLHPVPLPGVPLDGLEILLGVNRISMDRMINYKFIPGHHLVLILSTNQQNTTGG